jgi:16S rRNA processing protein RimM
VTVSDPAQDEIFILLGTVSRPHGIRGDLKVRSFAESAGSFDRYRRLFLCVEDGQPKIEYTNVQARVNGNTIILRLKECTDRGQAEQLAGMQIWLASRDLPPAEAGEFYLHTMVGKRARTTNGLHLGTVKGFLSSVQDVLVIRDGDHEYLVPAVQEFISAMNETEIVLNLPPGLLEINR